MTDPDDPGSNERDRDDRDTQRIPPVRPEGVPEYGYERELPSDVTWATYEGSEDRLPPEIREEELAGLRVSAQGVPLGPRSVAPLEEEPSSVIARYLFPTERFRGEWKKHWIHLIGEIILAILATLFLGWATGWLNKHHQGGFATAVLVIWVAVMVFVIWRFADWYMDRFILTNKRIMEVKGLITRSVAMMPLIRVTDMKYDQSPLGRMLNYGTFVVESAGQDQALRVIDQLPNPNELYLRIVEEMYEPEAVEARLARVPPADEMSDGS